MSLYERVAAKSGGGRALAVARLRRSVLVILHRAFNMSGLDSQAELAKRLRVRRSAVNQVFRGDGNVRISTLAEYLYEMGFEVDLTLVEAGELRVAAMENRQPVPAFANWSSSTSVTYATDHLRAIANEWDLKWNAIVVDANVHVALSTFHWEVCASTLSFFTSVNPTYESINMSGSLAILGAAS